jgi:quinol-cytochrome oxidoreductase complex cytochrome b subunit
MACTEFSPPPFGICIHILPTSTSSATVKDVFGFTLTPIILTVLTLKEPYILRDPDNFTPANPLVTPVHIQPE